MVVGILRLTVSIHGAQSLKDKRRVLRKIIERARSRYNASIAEVGDNDVWQRAQLGYTVVSNDRRFVDEVLSKLARDLESNPDVSLLLRESEIQSISQMTEEPLDKPFLNPSAEEIAKDSGIDLDEEERLLAAADAEDIEQNGGSPRESVGGGDAGGGENRADSDWLTESDFEGNKS